MGESGRERILRAALECFSLEGVAGTTLSRLRDAAGVGPGAFYHHFPGKYELVAALHAAVIARYHQDFLTELREHSDPEQAIRAIVAFHIGWCGEHLQEARFLFTERQRVGDELRAHNRAFFGELTAWWETHARHGALRRLDCTMRYVLWLGPAQELCRLWLSDRIPAPTPEQIAVLADAAWQSVRTDDR
jgi:AcrR family transcriptional regulator